MLGFKIKLPHNQSKIILWGQNRSNAKKTSFQMTYCMIEFVNLKILFFADFPINRINFNLFPPSL